MNIIRYGGPMSRTRRVGSPIGYSGLTGFVSVWATTGFNETITIPTQPGTFNAVVDWGDTSPPETITTYNGFTHVYEDIGEHTISIAGTFPNIFFNNAGHKAKIRRVLNLGTVGWTKLNNSFFGCSNLTQFTAGSTDTSAVTDMVLMFGFCSGLTSADLSSLNTSIVTSMAYMFFGCSGLTNLNLSSFNTSNVTNMAVMLNGCSGLTNLAGAENFIITGLNATNSLNGFFSVGKMTTAQYDNLLIKWEVQAVGIPAMTTSFGASILTLDGTAAAAKQSLINTYGWTVSDGVTP